MEDLSTVLKGAGLVFLGFFASKIFGYVYSIIIARSLAPSEIGILAVAAGVLGFVIMFANLGIPLGVLRYIPFYKSKGQEAKVKGTLLGGIGLNLVSSIIFGVGLFFAADFIGMGIYNEPVIVNLIKLFSIAVPLATISSLFIISFQGFKTIKYRVLTRNVMENFTKIAVFVVLFFIGFRVMAAALALVLSYLISLLLAFYFLEKKVYPFVRTKLKAKFELRELLNFSWPLFAATFFALLLTTIDMFMLGYFLNTAAVGIYSMSVTLSRIILVVNESLIILFLPIVTGYFAVGKREEMTLFFKTVTRWIFLFSVPILVFTILYAIPLLEAFYGATFVPGFMALSILITGFFFVGAVGPTQDMLKAIGKPRYDLINTIIAAGANIVLNLTLIPLYGITGAAIATASSYILWNVLSLVEVYLVLKIHPYSWAYFKPIIALAITTVPLWFLRNAVDVNLFDFPLNIVLLFVFSGGFMCVYLLLLVLIGGLNSEDMMVLRKLEERSGVKVEFIRNFIKRFS